MSKISASGKQHVEIDRKFKHRRYFLDKLAQYEQPTPTVAYVPFIGDGDIAYELYNDMKIYGADLDPDRVATAKSRLTNAIIKVADCDKFPFSGIEDTISICDYDSYQHPYEAFTTFWESNTKKSNRMVMFFTDGWKQAILRAGTYFDFQTMEKRNVEDTNDKRKIASNWYKTVTNYVESVISPYHIVDIKHYNRGPSMIYWGILVSNKPEDKKTTNGNLNKTQAKKQFIANLSKGMSVTASANSVGRRRTTMYAWRLDDIDFSAAWDDATEQGSDVYEDLLLEAAVSGNVQAIVHGLKMRGRYVEKSETKSEIDMKQQPISKLSDEELLRIIYDSKK